VDDFGNAGETVDIARISMSDTAKPQRNGRVERFSRTLKARTSSICWNGMILILTAPGSALEHCLERESKTCHPEMWKSHPAQPLG
jgi:hypothetical protein